MKVLERIVAQPGAPLENEIWLDTSQDPAVMKYHDGDEWKPIAGGGGGGSLPTDVLKYTEQSLTDTQKTQARTNIGAAEAGSGGGDPRQYRGGAILDLTGPDNPNYTIQVGEYDRTLFLLNDDVFTALTNDKTIGLVLVPDRFSLGLEYAGESILCCRNSYDESQYIDFIGIDDAHYSAGISIDVSTKIADYFNHAD